MRLDLNSRYIIWLLLFAPLLAICWMFLAGIFFYGEFIHITGDWSARLLIITLAATPLRKFLPRQNWTAWLVRQRRYFGLAAFAYAVPHLLAYLNKLRDVARIVAEGTEPGMLAGWLALLIFLALAVTSNNSSVRKLGRRWKSLHRLVYLAAVCTFLHWLLLAFDPIPGAIHAGALMALQCLRFRSRNSANVAARINAQVPKE